MPEVSNTGSNVNRSVTHVSTSKPVKQVSDCPICSPEHVAKLGHEMTVAGLSAAGIYGTHKRACQKCGICAAAALQQQETTH